MYEVMPLYKVMPLYSTVQGNASAVALSTFREDTVEKGVTSKMLRGLSVLDEDITLFTNGGGSLLQSTITRKMLKYKKKIRTRNNIGQVLGPQVKVSEQQNNHVESSL